MGIETDRIAISSNHLSHDQQVLMVFHWLREISKELADTITSEFPEILDPVFEICHFDTEAMGVDPQWSHWLADTLEETGLVYWEDGEPWSY